MLVSVLDLPFTQAETGLARRELVTNTKLPRKVNQHQPDYYFDSGFYQSAKNFTSHPVHEVTKNELFKRALNLINKFDQVLPDFKQINSTILNEAVSRLATELINHPFQQIVLEKTPDDSLLSKAIWKGKGVFIDIDFNTYEPSGYEVQITAYEGNDCVLSVAGSFDFAFDQLMALNRQPA